MCVRYMQASQTKTHKQGWSNYVFLSSGPRPLSIKVKNSPFRAQITSKFTMSPVIRTHPILTLGFMSLQILLIFMHALWYLFQHALAYIKIVF